MSNLKILNNWNFDNTWTSEERRSALTLGAPSSTTVLPLDFNWVKTEERVHLHGTVSINEVWLTLVNPITHEFFEIVRYDEYADGVDYQEPDMKYPYGHNAGLITKKLLILERDLIDDHGIEIPEELGVLADEDVLKIKNMADTWRASHGNSLYMFWSIDNGTEMSIDPGQSETIPVLKLF